MPLNVSEIFYSIQGESSFAGSPCIFVRLCGCNLRCTYCDTKHAYDGGEEMEIAAIMEKAAAYKCRLVEVTGGEPLLQEETPLLIEKLLGAGYNVLLETNGSIDIGGVNNRCIKIMDIKCPSSGEEQQNNFKNIDRLTDNDEVKFVIGTRDDFLYAKKIMGDFNNRASRIKHVYFSPVSGKLSPAALAAWMLEDNVNVRLSLQLHKIIWPDLDRGV